MWDGSAPGLPAATFTGALDCFDRNRSNPLPTAINNTAPMIANGRKRRTLVVYDWTAGGAASVI